MLRKLIGYDLESIFKVLAIFYSLAVFFGLLARIFFSFENSLALNIIGEVCSGAAISMMCSIIINNLMRMWVRFKANFYGDEAYLTHTLPVEKHTHYFSKMLTAVITLLVSFGVIGIVLFIAYYSKENLQLVKDILFPLAQAYDSTVLGFLAVILAVLFLEFLNILQCGFSGIILGHKMNTAKTGFSVLYGFIVYSASQLTVVIIMFIVALFNKDFMNLFVTNEIVSIDTLKSAVWLAVASYSAITLALWYINIRLFKKGVNVD